MEKKQIKITADYHVHCGQFEETYYSAEMVMKVLHENGIKDVWLSSTSSCVKWENAKEKKEILSLIANEMQEAVLYAKEFDMNLTPLYWVMPQRYIEGESVANIMDNSIYKGFKIHPKFDDWDKGNPYADILFEEVCDYALKHNMPILIHTGYDENVLPNRFESFFKIYSQVKFILAHCKDAFPIIEMMKKYNNVYGDLAFCPQDSYNAIYLAGFKNRMQSGTDFPLTAWFEQLDKVKNTTNTYLSTNYKDTILALSKMIS